MQNSTKNWLKIYLFYGAIFFSFGVLSWIGHANIIGDFTRKINSFLSTAQLYSDLPHANETEIPVFKSPVPDVVLFYPAGLEEKEHDTIDKVKRLLDGYCEQTEHKPVPSPQSLTDAIMNDISGDMLFGMNIAQHSILNRQKVDLYFNLPKDDESRLLKQIESMGLHSPRVQRITRKQAVIYHIQWLAEESSVFGEISRLLMERLRSYSKGFSEI